LIKTGNAAAARICRQRFLSYPLYLFDLPRWKVLAILESE
jgi:hypothetical protein